MINVKCKCLVSGFPAMEEEYEIAGFKLYNLKLDYIKIQPNPILETLDPISFITFCQYKLENDKNYYINYFENKELFEIEISDEDYLKIKNNELIDIKKYNQITNKIQNLERKIRLELNIPFAIHIASIKLYDENIDTDKYYNLLFETSFWFRLKEIDEDFNNNTRFHLNFDLIENIKNERLKRAFEIFYDSFDSNKIEIRFILLFTSLECIFNLDGKQISNTVSTYVAKIISLFEVEKYQDIYKEIKNLYSIRSNYIHGNKNGIVSKNAEKKLRKIVRQVLIFYYLIYINKHFSNEKMLKYLNNSENIDLNERLILKTLLSNNYKEQQQGIIDEIANNIRSNNNE